MAVFPTTSPRQGAGAKAGWRRDWYRLLFAGDFESLNVDPFFILRLWPLLDRLGIEGQKCSGGGNRQRPRENGNRVLDTLEPQITLSTSAQAAAIREHSVHLSQRLTPLQRYGDRSDREFKISWSQPENPHRPDIGAHTVSLRGTALTIRSGVVAKICISMFGRRLRTRLLRLVVYPA